MKKICWFCFDFRVDHKTEEDSKAYEAVKGSLSTKIEAVVKTLIKIRNDDPTAKSLVFSTWSSVLDILESALQTNDIQFATLHVQGKFKRNLQKFKVWYVLEIKPCGLGSRIRDMETDLIYWWTFRLLFISFGKQNWHFGMDRTLS